MNSPYVKSYNLIITYHVMNYVQWKFFLWIKLSPNRETLYLLNCLIRIGCQIKKDYGMSTTIIIIQFIFYVHNFLTQN